MQCPECKDHPGWATPDLGERKDPQDVCRECLGSGVPQRTWIVVNVYNTEADGSPVLDDVDLDDMPRTYHGPFANEKDAEHWALDVYPDDDTDLHEQWWERYEPEGKHEGGYVNDPSHI